MDIYVNKIILFSALSLILFIFLLCIIYLCGIALSKITLRTIENKINSNIYNEEIGSIKKIYRFCLTVSALVFYVFLPLPIYVTFFFLSFLVYFLDYYNFLNSIFLAAIIIFFIYVLVSVFKGLLINKEIIPDELELERENYPLLFAVCDEISSKLQLSPIDHIFLNHDSSICVFERGNILQHISRKSKRCLVIGISVLNNLSVEQFKAIISHEFGHFYHGDTYGGLTLYVRRSILNANELMEKDSVNKWSNPTWIYFSLFGKAFLRISQGAAKLGEVLADQISAELYSPDLLSQGLLTIAKNSIEFSISSQIELMDALNDKREPNNLYTLNVPEKWPEDVKFSYGYTFMSFNQKEEFEKPVNFIEHEIKKETLLKSKPYDSHPSIKERIILLQRMKKKNSIVNNKKVIVMFPKILDYQKLFTNMLFDDLITRRDHMAELVYLKRMEMLDE